MTVEQIIEELENNTATADMLFLEQWIWLAREIRNNSDVCVDSPRAMLVAKIQNLMVESALMDDDTFVDIIQQ